MNGWQESRDVAGRTLCWYRTRLGGFVDTVQQINLDGVDRWIVSVTKTARVSDALAGPLDALAGQRGCRQDNIIDDQTIYVFGWWVERIFDTADQAKRALEERA